MENKKPKYFHKRVIPIEWEIKTFGSVCDKLIDGTHFSPQSKEGPFKYLTSKNIRDEGLVLENICYVSEQEHKEIYKRCPVMFGDVLLTKDGASTGACCVNTLKEEFSLLSSVAVLRTDSQRMANNYLVQFIKSPIGQNVIQAEISGQAITRITLEKIRAFKIICPPVQEQFAIAKLLDAWDNAIITTNLLITQKELRKKWLMQNLMTGKKRLKGYDGEWKKFHLSECFQFIKSYSISRDGLTQKKGDRYCIHYGDIHAYYETEFLDFNTQNNIPRMIDDAIRIQEKDYLKEGDIIMADASEDYKGVGEAIIVLNIGNRIAVGGLHTIVLREYALATDANYRGYLFASEKVRNELRMKATGTSVYSVTKTTLESLILNLPSIKEQSAIARILQAADKEIQFLKTKTEKLKEQKKGLMQLLLTGKKRLKIETNKN